MGKSRSLLSRELEILFKEGSTWVIISFLGSKFLDLHWFNNGCLLQYWLSLINVLEIEVDGSDLVEIGIWIDWEWMFGARSVKVSLDLDGKKRGSVGE